MTIDKLIDNTTRLDFNEVIHDAVADTSHILADLQTDQMLHGFNALGNKIGFYANEEYAEQKSRQNSLPGFGVVDLRREGNFYHGITVKANATSVTITSTDDKTDKLKKKYGDQIFGLNVQYTSEYIQDLAPVAIDKIKNQILKT